MVWRCVVNTQVKGRPAAGAIAQERQGVVRDPVCDIARLVHKLAVPDHGGLIVGSGAHLVDVPVREPVLWDGAGPQVPLAR